MNPVPTPLDSVDHAGWFVAPLSSELTVHGLVPPVFEAYVRILHPAAADDGRPVRWAEVADDQGTTLHASVQFPQLARRRDDGRLHGWRGDDPREGSLDRETLEALIAVLAAHTATPETIWLNLWDGWGQLPDAWSRSRRVRDHGYREYFAFRCRLGEVLDLAERFEGFTWDESIRSQSSMTVVTAEYVGDGDPDEELPPRHPDELDYRLQTPQQWWPDDRAWAVATEIDDDCTIVAGSEALADTLLAHPGLETLRIGRHDSLADTVNPKPPR